MVLRNPIPDEWKTVRFTVDKTQAKSYLDRLRERNPKAAELVEKCAKAFVKEREKS